MKTIEKIRKFLSENFEQSAQSGVIASNSKVKSLGFGQYRVQTSSQGTHQNDIKGSGEDVLKQLNEIVEIDKMMSSKE